MALALSMYSIGVFLAKSDHGSVCRGFNQTNSVAPLLAAMITASVVERAVVFISRLVQNTAPLANIAITPVVEFQGALSPTDSA